MKALLPLSCTLLATIAVSQTTPGGPGTPGGGPGTPASGWSVDTVTRTGSTTGTHYYYDSNNLVVTENWTFNWSTGVWSSSRGPGSGPAPFLPFTNSTQESRTVTSNSSGSVKIRLKWNGSSAPPAQVYFAAQSSAQSVYSMNQLASGSGSVSNGIGSPTVIDQTDSTWETLNTPRK